MTTLKKRSAIIINFTRLRFSVMMKICQHLISFLPLHEGAAVDSRHLLFRSMKRPCDRPLSQLCFRASRSSLLSPWEQRRRSWTSSDNPSRPAVSQGPDTWQPEGEARSRNSKWMLDSPTGLSFTTTKTKRSRGNTLYEVHVSNVSYSNSSKLIGMND